MIPKKVPGTFSRFLEQVPGTFLVFLFCWSAFGLFDNQFLTLEQARAHWGQSAFSEEKFRSAKPDERGGMAIDLLVKEQLNGRKLTDIKKVLGPSDAKYEAGRVPAYKLGSDSQYTYILVFLPDFSGKTVEEVKIYREPLEHPGGAVTAGSARLPMTIDGPAAANIYRHLTAAPEDKNKKTGKNIACTREGDNYRCAFELDAEGTAFPR